MNPFAKTYTTFSLVKLLEIKASPENYQPLAVEAALSEIALRNVSKPEMKQAQEELDVLLARKFERDQKTQAQIDSLTGKNWKLFGDLTSSVAREIKWIVIIYLVFTLYVFGNSFSYVEYVFSEGVELDWMGFWLIGSYLLYLITLFTFWKRMKIGWILMIFQSVLNAVGASMSIIQTIKFSDSIYNSMEIGWYFYLGNILKLLVFAAFAYLLLQKPMRKAFGWGKHSEDLDVLDEELIIDSE